MSQKKPNALKMKNTLNELDSALEQWDSLTNKPQGEQVSNETAIQKKAKTLLKELREQINEFDETDETSPKDI